MTDAAPMETHEATGETVRSIRRVWRFGTVECGRVFGAVRDPVGEDRRDAA